MEGRRIATNNNGSTQTQVNQHQRFEHSNKETKILRTAKQGFRMNAERGSEVFHTFAVGYKNE
jgi:urease beta subunit